MGRRVRNKRLAKKLAKLEDRARQPVGVAAAPPAEPPKKRMEVKDRRPTRTFDTFEERRAYLNDFTKAKLVKFSERHGIAIAKSWAKPHMVDVLAENWNGVV